MFPPKRSGCEKTERALFQRSSIVRKLDFFAKSIALDPRVSPQEYAVFSLVKSSDPHDILLDAFPRVLDRWGFAQGENTARPNALPCSEFRAQLRD